MRRIAVGVGISLGVWFLAVGTIQQDLVAAPGHHIGVTDDCDPNADWGPNGCLLEEGTVSRAEFNLFLNSPLSSAVVGHPSWRNDPGYLTVQAGQKVKIRNTGGRTHTFTKVVNFGGGRVAPLSTGLIPAPECAAAVDLVPGQRDELTDLSVGNHAFQCCIHPWMRAVVEVMPEE
jgi:plastocyanin